VKILAPASREHEIEALCDAGAHEFYCGVDPPDWERCFGATAVHRRNPRSAGVADVDELRRIVALAHPRPVFATLNAPSYPAGAVEHLLRFGRVLLNDIGVGALIVGDWELLLALAEAGLASRVHVSSLASCRNAGAASFYRGLGVARIILPRQVTLREIAQCATAGVELEVFALNDGCPFEEGICSTTHALRPFCIDDRIGGKQAALDERYAFWKWTLNNCGCQTSRGYTLGPCGLCALPRLARSGVASLKVVGREASTARKVASVRLASAALKLATTGAQAADIRGAVVSLRGAPELCRDAHLCYYPDVWDGDDTTSSAACPGPGAARDANAQAACAVQCQAGAPVEAGES
jgi:collagenase-like PrtC family protease